MQEKRKKFWLIFSVSVLSVLAICFVFGMITNLKNVGVEFRQRLASGSRLEENILEKVKNDGEFEYGKGLLFVDIAESIDKIEKKNPFVKVEQVVRDFPNNVKVYISERVPCSYICSGNYYYVLDKDFKVLDKFVADSEGILYLEENYLETVYEIDYTLTFSPQEGDFVTDNGKMKLYKNVYAGIVGALESVSAVKSVEFENDKVNIVMKKDNISFDDGVLIELDGEDDLVLKTYAAIEFFETIDKTKTAQTIKVQKSQTKNKYVAYIISES